MKTRLTAHGDGRVVIETQGRGKAAERWLARLQGGKPLALVGPQQPR